MNRSLTSMNKSLISTNKKKPDILYEDADLLVCVKPAGVPTQSSQVGTPDMVSILKRHIFQDSDTRRPPYLAVIHRLDQPVEGLLVFAKTPAAAKELNRQLTSFGFGKYYRALLDGVPSRMEDTLEHYLCKDARTNTSRVCDADTPGAKKARLHYRILCTEGNQSLADIVLDTGRHHQIRVQMSAIGCPIAGDTKYGASRPQVFASGRQSPEPSHSVSRGQIALYACRLEFLHPRTGKPMHFELERHP